MIAIDNSKFKPHNKEEARWLVKLHEAVDKAVTEYNLPLTELRVGRQQKAYGSTSVNDHKLEASRDGSKIVVWVNGGQGNCNNFDFSRLVKFIATHCCTWSYTSRHMSREDMLAVSLRFGLNKPIPAAPKVVDGVDITGLTLITHTSQLKDGLKVRVLYQKKVVDGVILKAPDHTLKDGYVIKGELKIHLDGVECKWQDSFRNYNKGPAGGPCVGVAIGRGKCAKIIGSID